MKEMHPDIEELLAQRATEGLDEQDAEKLRRSLAGHGVTEATDFDLAAAAAANAFGLESAAGGREVPESLKAKLRDDADRYFGRDNVVAIRQNPLRQGGWNWGWATAAALALVLLMTNLVSYDGSTDFRTERERLINVADDTVVIPWATPQDPQYAQVAGNVVWSSERQAGYMLLTGMPANDPSTSQYQLWLVDPERDSHPVDGGVFDIPAGASTVVIPIDAKLAVSGPKVFAITREQPGGVVVSKGPLLVIASAG